MARVRLAGIALAAGLGLIIATQLSMPLHAPPLYDGVIVTQPYRYVLPGPDQFGSPSSASVVKPLEGGQSQALSAATAESPPQAQIIAPPGAFAAPAGVTELHVAIVPIAPSPADSVVGNGYRFTVTDEHGNPVPLATGVQPTIVLRAPPEAYGVTLVQLVGNGWQDLSTQPGGQPHTYLANVASLGVFAARGSIDQGLNVFDPQLLGVAGVIAAAVVIVVTVLLVRSNRRRPSPGSSPPMRRSRVPRKRRGRP